MSPTPPDGLCLFCPPNDRRPARSRGACGGCYTRMKRNGEEHLLLPRGKRGPEKGTTGPNRERDKEIMRRIRAGEAGVDVARDFGISKQRILQICQEQGEPGLILAREKQADAESKERRKAGR